MYILRESGWQFVTSGSAGFSIDIVAAEGGLVDLLDTENKAQRFYFGGLGAGISTPGIKLPKSLGFLTRILSGRMINSAGSTTKQFNMGHLYKTGLIGDRKLTRADITGACVIAELGVSLPIQGRTATLMMMGMNPQYYYASLATPAMQVFDFATGHGGDITPKALMWIWGDTRGLVAGLTGYVGYLR